MFSSFCRTVVLFNQLLLSQCKLFLSVLHLGVPLTLELYFKTIAGGLHTPVDCLFALGDAKEPAALPAVKCPVR